MNTLEDTVYGSDDDCDGDRCPDCWAETEPFIANLPNLPDEQLHLLSSRVHDLLDKREMEGGEDYDGCCGCNCDCHDLPDDDGCDCCDDGMCPDCYRKEFGDTDETITDEVQLVVDDVRRERKESAQRLEDGLRDIKEGRDTSKKGSDLKSVDTSDGLFSEFAVYVAAHPEQRFFQAIRNVSGYDFIFGSTAKSFDDYSQLEDTFNLTTRGPRKEDKR